MMKYPVLQVLLEKKKDTKGLPPLPHLTISRLAKTTSAYHKTLFHYVLEMLRLRFSWTSVFLVLQTSKRPKMSF